LDLIATIFQYLRPLGKLDQHVSFALGICGKAELYSGGVIFQALVPNLSAESNSSNNMAMNTATTLNEHVNRSLFAASSSSTASSSRSDSLLNAYETIALGGQYDKLIASFMPPTSPITFSAIGVNFALEKIVSSMIAYQIKNNYKPLSNPVHARRLKKALHGIDSHSSNILLYSSKGIFIKERLALASYLWHDNLPAIYLHPPNLNHAQLKQYAREHSVRWIILFRRNQLKSNGTVAVCDLIGGGGSGSKSVADKSGAREQDLVWLQPNEVSSYVRTRMAGGKKEAEMAANAALMTTHHAHHSSYSDNRGPSHSHSFSHSKPNFYVHIMDASSMKQAAKTQILTQVKRLLTPLLAGLSPSPYAICAVDLPFSLIRSLSSAFYSATPTALQQALEEAHARQRGLCEMLIAYMRKKSGGAMMGMDTSSSSSKSSSKTTSGDSSKEKVDTLYIFSIPDKRVDFILFNS